MKGKVINKMKRTKLRMGGVGYLTKLHTQREEGKHNLKASSLFFCEVSL